jgi:hypothetical protein
MHSLPKAFFNRFQRAICQNDRRAAFEVVGDKLTGSMFFQLFTVAPKRMKTDF